MLTNILGRHKSLTLQGLIFRDGRENPPKG